MAWNGPLSNLTHRWPMDDAGVSGTLIRDVVGSLNGTAGSSVSSTPGPYTTARLIGNDANALISLTGSPIANLAAAFSVGMWVNKANWAAQSFDGGSSRAFNWFDGTLYFNCADNAGNTNKINFGDSNALSSRDVTPALVPTNSVWIHYTYTWDTTTAKLYINGMQDLGATNTASDGPTHGTDTNNMICARNTSGTVRPWNASMYQLVTYSKALSQAEVTQLYGADAGVVIGPFGAYADSGMTIVPYGV